MFKEILWLKKQKRISIAMLIQQIKENVKFSCQPRKVTKALDMDDIICQVLVWPVGFAPTRYIASLPKGQCRVLFFSHNNFYSVLVRSYSQYIIFKERRPRCSLYNAGLCLKFGSVSALLFLCKSPNGVLLFNTNILYPPHKKNQ